MVRSSRGHVGSDALGQVGQRRLRAELAAQLLARRFQLAADAAHATRPRIAPQGVNHGAAHAAFRKRLELDAAALVEPMGGVDQANHPVLHQVAQVDRVGHGGRHAARQRLDKRQTRRDAVSLVGR